MKNALLFANGEVTAKELNKVKGRSFDVVVAADGGAGNALLSVFLPDYIVGDLDSMTPEIKEKLPETQFIRKPSQELNDLEKTLIFCEEKGITEITLLGITGKRLDHTLNNLSVLCRYIQKFHLKK